MPFQLNKTSTILYLLALGILIALLLFLLAGTLK